MAAILSFGDVNDQRQNLFVCHSEAEALLKNFGFEFLKSWYRPKCPRKIFGFNYRATSLIKDY